MTNDHEPSPMRPIDGSREADEQWGPFDWGGADLLEHFTELSGQVRVVVPQCMGMSMSLRTEQITFTVVSTSAEIALLDAVQYVDGGPCVDALDQGTVVDVPRPSDLEERWRLHAAATARYGIRSTLSLPVLRDGHTVAGFNLYATTATSFDGKHEQVAGLLGAWSGGAVTNADLPFRTRDLAERAPTLLRESTDLAIAAALLARSRDLDYADAEDRLRRASLRAAVPLPELARSVIDLLHDH